MTSGDQPPSKKPGSAPLPKIDPDGGSPAAFPGAQPDDSARRVYHPGDNVAVDADGTALTDPSDETQSYTSATPPLESDSNAETQALNPQDTPADLAQTLEDPDEESLSSTQPSTPAEQVEAPALTTLYTIPYLDWEPVGPRASEAQRAALLDALSRMKAALSSTVAGSIKRLTLGGYTALLSQAAEVRPDLAQAFVQLQRTGRVDLGVCYVPVDSLLVSGEALVRNLLQARRDAARYGFKLRKVAYLPGHGGHAAQLPQILRGFGVDAVFLHHGSPVPHLPFNWKAPNGSQVLVVSAPITPTQDAAASISQQRYATPDGPFLWMLPADPRGSSTAAFVPQGLEMPVEQAGLADYVAAVRHGLPDSMRPAYQNELRLRSTQPGTFVLSGRPSARLYLKQRNSRLQQLMVHAAEPLLALAATIGSLDERENACALTRHAWRLLMQTQARSALGGHAVDAQHDADALRADQVAAVADHVVMRALDALPGVVHGPGDIVPETQGQVYLMVWNAHNHSVQQMVEITLDGLKADAHPARYPARYPARLLDPDGQPVDFIWDSQAQALGFIAAAPPVGMAVYTLELGLADPGEAHVVKRYHGTQINDWHGATLLIENSRLTWRHFASGSEINDLLRFEDGGDAGDTFSYSPPEHDLIEQGALAGAVEVEECSLYRRLKLRHRMRVAPALTDRNQRERGLRLLDLHTEVTVYKGVPGVYFRTRFSNTAQDHRLRVHLRTGIYSDTVLADAPFQVIERDARQPGPEVVTEAGSEAASSVYPMQTACAVEGATGAMALLTRGLPAFEAIQEHKQTTLALTLVRAVGHISRDDLRTRRGHVSADAAVGGAQCLRDVDAEYALMPLSAGSRAALIQAGQQFNAPLMVFQYDAPPDVMRRSYVSVRAEDAATGGVVLWSLKPPEHGVGMRAWVLRLSNPDALPVEAVVHPFRPPAKAHRMPMAEDEAQPLGIDDDGRVKLKLAPHEVVTLRLIFEA